MRRRGVREAVSGVSGLILMGPVALIWRQRRRTGLFSSGEANHRLVSSPIEACTDWQWPAS
jgi:hypothetical protein